MPFIVTALSQDGATAELETALRSAGLDLDGFDVVRPDDFAPMVSTAGLVDAAILTGGGLETGTGVPDLTARGVPGISGGPRIVADNDADTLWDRLADLGIPDDEVENYAEALERGRSIVAYHATAGTAALVEGIFRDSGLGTIKAF